MSDLLVFFDQDLLASVLRISTPILLAALGGLLSMRAGVFNIGLEGMMLAGAFFGIVCVNLTGNSWIGLLGGLLIGGILSLVLSLVIIRFKADHIIAGIAINIFGLGLTSFLLNVIFDVTGSFRPKNIMSLPVAHFAIFEKIPFLDSLLNGQSVIVYAGLLLVIITSIIIYWTPFGISVRTVGEHPLAALSAGIKPAKVQLLCNLWSGCLSGVAGAYLSICVVSEFTENMIAGRGFTAFTAIIFGGQNPVFTFLASLIFGLADAIGVRVQLEGFGLPPSVLQMFPYIMTILVLVISSAIQLKRNRGILGGLGQQ